MKKHKS